MGKQEQGREVFCTHHGGRHGVESAEVAASWTDRIQRALEEERFVLYAQPIMDLRSGRISQYELLLRMVRENGELLLPGAFLPSAERSGIVAEIDAWVARRAIALIDAAARAGRDLTLEVNLSGRTLSDPQIADEIERALAASQIDPASLIFEMTETMAVVNLSETRKLAETLTRLGCRFALDDFGAGFGSFFYLKYLPVDYLKIDGDFIVNLGENETDQAVVQAITELSRRLGKQVIAEFVGDSATLDLIRKYGVDFAQGHHIGRPRPVAELLQFGCGNESERDTDRRGFGIDRPGRAIARAASSRTR